MERFFSNPSNAPRWDANTGITLLSGPPCCGKTSLLFQFAVNRAAESGRGVVFICSKGRLESNPPFLSQGVDPSMSLLQRIQIKYIENVDDIRKYFAAFHLLDDFPAAVIVDDFADFFSERSCQQRYGTTRARDLAMVRVLALCYNAIGHANAKLGTLGSCNLLLSDVHQDDTPRSLFIYQRWIDSIYTIRGDGKGSYILQNIGSPETGSKKARKAKYSIALQYLVLEETSS
ncbi:hypothetical protein BDA96_01G240600 [Sorghum bicolor]|uniref:Uncharacterized protein n=3 Tax=Sorghum bicolor TaxID=4558 RepID=A0A921RZ14_SORBI|nr:uncharacterized protein LOC8070504 isoform X2 [Sorghum bicolor]KAG0549269.1 hypothetical protein BDA96_01G240600 [Sorghum bicolor]KXG38391.1 hypothetical protein SORBI_3001G226200 [Sorghum bicolor]|eukprot:XP_021307205.1 uncharacterized protein LOC8070504 isoform X2 [Sorghum bicolor]